MLGENQTKNTGKALITQDNTGQTSNKSLHFYHYYQTLSLSPYTVKFDKFLYNTKAELVPFYYNAFPPIF